MRMNKYAPFLIAVLIHVLAFSFYLFPFIPKNHNPGTVTSGPSGSTGAIDLTGFSVASSGKSTGGKASPGSSVPASAASAASSTSATEASMAETEGEQGVHAAQGEQAASASGIVMQSHEPQYPPLARQKGLEGKVRLRAFYNNEGSITQVDVVDSSGTKMLDESARKALLAWKIKAGLGSASFEKTFQFKLND